jgi:hypothetical protein
MRWSSRPPAIWLIDMEKLSLACLGSIACLCLPANVTAGQSVRLGASFAPYRLGQRTTIAFDFQVGAPAGQIPTALTDVDIRYPEGLGIVLSGLGLEVCSQATLEAAGSSGCPADSIMGHGSALAEMRFGSQLVRESAQITIARAPDEDGHIALLLYASGPSPVDTQILSPAQLIPASAPFGGRLNIQLPLVASVPGAPDVGIAQMHATLGPRGVTYFERADGNTLGYQPKGILLPRLCPRGGFPFAAEFNFLGGSSADARTRVPCPARVGAAVVTGKGSHG